MLNDFINKNVVIILNDNYKKFGKLTSVDEIFLYLEYYNGKRVVISKSDIKTIEYDEQAEKYGGHSQ